FSGKLVTRIFIDADACPVKDEIYRVAGRHKLLTYVVSNSWMRLPQSPLIEQVVVDDGFDAADNWIAEQAAEKDVVITSDIPLADRALKKGAVVMGPGGKHFTEQAIGMKLAMRDLNTHLRDIGEISGYNAAFSKKDRSNFLNSLENTIVKLKK
ncbi:MAG: YaiI/YqxD family protein, partial [Sneathiella sp.]